MIWRTLRIGFLFLVFWGPNAFSGAFADTNEANAAVAISAAGNERGTNQLVSSQFHDGNHLEFDRARLLSPNDAVSVTVYQEDDLATKTVIDKNGMVMLPLLGQLRISGMTVEQATERIRQLYDKDFLVNPQVNLIVEHFAERRFSVLGQVQHPGNFDFPQNESVNLLEAIAISGGYTRLGAPSKVDVRRIEDGSPKIYHFDAEQMSKDTKKAPFDILPNDIITVGERTF